MAIPFEIVSVMSSGMIRGLGTVVVFVAFVGLALWVFSGKRSRNSLKRECCRSPTS